MSKRDKLRRKLKNNPKGVKFSELETLLARFGFILVRVSGSHHVFRYSDSEHIVNIVVSVHGNSVKVDYVKDAIQVLDEFFPEAQDTDQETEESDEQDD